MARTNNDDLITYTKELTHSFQRWQHLYEFGGQDPFYADGMNLNLVRNHIIYYKQKIEALLKDESENSFFSTPYPDIYYKPTPEAVSYDYMARADEIRSRAREQLALYEQDENFRFCLDAHNTVFQNGETKATKAANLQPGKTAGLAYLQKYIDDDDLIGMRRVFWEPYEKKAVRWAESATELKQFLESEHNPADDVSVRDDYYDDALDDDMDIEAVPAEVPGQKASLDEQISIAAAKKKEYTPNIISQEEQLSLF